MGFWRSTTRSPQSGRLAHDRAQQSFCSLSIDVLISPVNHTLLFSSLQKGMADESLPVNEEDKKDEARSRLKDAVGVFKDNNIHFFIHGGIEIEFMTVEDSKEADTMTARATHRISRGIHNKEHSVTRKFNSDGKVDTMQALHNLNEGLFTSLHEPILSSCVESLDLDSIDSLSRIRDSVATKVQNLSTSARYGHRY